MGSTSTHELKQSPEDQEFWNEERELLFVLLLPYIRESIVTGARNAFLELSATADLGIAWDIINESAISWAATYTSEIVAQVSKTSMAAFLEHFEPWVRSGEPLQSLVDVLTPYYGPVRANMVAVTETTRAFAQGNLLAWKKTGMVDGFNVMTAEDDKVCPICIGEKLKNPHTMDQAAPAYHVNCRCYIQPIVSLDA